MEIIICVLSLAILKYEAEAGIDTGFGTSSNGLGDSAGSFHYSPLTGGDYSGQDFSIEKTGHNLYGGQDGHDMHGGQVGHRLFGGDGTHDVTGGHSGLGSYSHPGGFDVSNGQNGHFPVGQKNDYTLAFTQGQDFSGHDQPNFDSGHPSLGLNFGGDSYLEAARDFGSEKNNGAAVSHQGDFSRLINNEEQYDGNQPAPGDHGAFNQGAEQSFVLQNGGHEFSDEHNFGNLDAVPVGEQVDEEHPVQIPLYKHIAVPIHKPVTINVPKPILVGIPQPYPVKVPVNKPVAVPVETEISIPIEKLVPYPIVKHIPYPVEKHVPIKVEKTVAVHVPQPYPVKVPVYKTIHHKSHH